MKLRDKGKHTPRESEWQTNGPMSRNRNICRAVWYHVSTCFLTCRHGEESPGQSLHSGLCCEECPNLPTDFCPQWGEPSSRQYLAVLEKCVCILDALLHRAASEWDRSCLTGMTIKAPRTVPDNTKHVALNECK